MKKVLEGRFIIMLLFFGCMLFFNWPLLSIVDEGIGRLLYLFLFWALAITGLWLHCRSIKRHGEDEGDEQ